MICPNCKQNVRFGAKKQEWTAAKRIICPVRGSQYCTTSGGHDFFEFDNYYEVENQLKGGELIGR